VLLIFSDPDPDPTFQLVSNPSTRFFLNILNSIFLFILPSCKCFRLHIMTRYKLCMEIFLRNLYFQLCIFVEKLLFGVVLF
jgi:hypothetical protein